MRNTYTASVVELLLSGKDVEHVLQNLKKVLVKRGHEKLLPKILKDVAARLEANHDEQVPTVSVREASDLETFEEYIEEALRELKASEVPKITIDTTLVGGFVAEHAHKRVDKSYKEALLSLYRKVTN